MTSILAFSLDLYLPGDYYINLLQSKAVSTTPPTCLEKPMPYFMTNKGGGPGFAGSLRHSSLGYNAIFFGEEHGSRTDHEAELTVLTELARA